MDIKVENVSKKYGYLSILKDINLTIDKGSVTGILGPNGSGKSTLMKIISGYLTPSKGQIKYQSEARSISKSELYQKISFSAPYISNNELFTLKETIQFHSKFKSFRQSLDYNDFLDVIQLKDTKEKYLLHFSSGMKQKVNLALSVLSNTPLLLLDEPTSYLDNQARQWFYKLLEENTPNRTVIIASNDDADFYACNQKRKIEEGRISYLF